MAAINLKMSDSAEGARVVKTLTEIKNYLIIEVRIWFLRTKFAVKLK